MSTSDRDRAIDDALTGRAPAGHPDLEAVAVFAAELRARADRVPARPSPAVAALLRGEKDLATYVELDTERTRRRPALIWAAAAAVAVALGGVAAAQPWDGSGNTPTAASVTVSVETTAPASTAPPTSEGPRVTTTVMSESGMSPTATAAATVPPVTVSTPRSTVGPTPTATVKARPPETTKTTVPPPPPPKPGLEAAKARWQACAERGRQEGLTPEQVMARCGNDPNLEGYRAARATWETCMRESGRTGPTAICGPEPDPAAFGFVPPIWPLP